MTNILRSRITAVLFIALALVFAMFVVINQKNDSDNSYCAVYRQLAANRSSFGKGNAPSKLFQVESGDPTKLKEAYESLKKESSSEMKTDFDVMIRIYSDLEVRPGDLLVNSFTAKEVDDSLYNNTATICKLTSDR